MSKRAMALLQCQAGGNLRIFQSVDASIISSNSQAKFLHPWRGQLASVTYCQESKTGLTGLEPVLKSVSLVNSVLNRFRNRFSGKLNPNPIMTSFSPLSWSDCGLAYVGRPSTSPLVLSVFVFDFFIECYDFGVLRFRFVRFWFLRRLAIAIWWLRVLTTPYPPHVSFFFFFLICPQFDVSLQAWFCFKSRLLRAMAPAATTSGVRGIPEFQGTDARTTYTGWFCSAMVEKEIRVKDDEELWIGQKIGGNWHWNP